MEITLISFARTCLNGVRLLVDRFGRPLTNLRVSVTAKCNYNCVFCHREGEDLTPDFLSVDDIEIVSQAAYSQGINSFKLTGGEPLLRQDIAEIVSRIKNLGRDVEVSMTSNGYFLSEYAGRLTEAGLDRINVSLHAIDQQKYLSVTAAKGLGKVLKGLAAAKDYGLPVKLNFVLTSVNYGELPKVLDYASRMEFNLNLIELIPMGLGREYFDKLYFPVEKVLPILAERAEKVEHRDLHNRPVFFLSNGTRVEVIANYCNPSFCLKCTRIRLTHDGKLKPCLNRNDNLVDIKGILRNAAASRETKLELLSQAIREVNSRREPFFKLVEGKCATVDGKIIGTPRYL
ncbi:MAG: GTP 3',8-cyclase MoaA [Infirmifilum sp.]